ncbi:S26 family signal peptidase, partial [Streptomyces olivaceus]|uniref:S26 family signal peptidase n=1 Tax=Streptomyces olivaceus TaxID=47716 RepID=UPI003659BC07
ALFVLGDHRSGSSDSRDHLGSPGGGMIPVDRLIGRADWIVWPFGHATHLDRPDAYADVPDAEAGAVSGPAGEREAGGDSGAAGGWGAGGVSGAAGGGVRRAESVDG